jgi:hypothetical protein
MCLWKYYTRAWRVEAAPLAVTLASMPSRTGEGGSSLFWQPSHGIRPGAALGPRRRKAQGRAGCIGRARGSRAFGDSERVWRLGTGRAERCSCPPTRAGGRKGGRRAARVIKGASVEEGVRRGGGRRVGSAGLWKGRVGKRHVQLGRCPAARRSWLPFGGGARHRRVLRASRGCARAGAVASRRRAHAPRRPPPPPQMKRRPAGRLLPAAAAATVPSGALATLLGSITTGPSELPLAGTGPEAGPDAGVLGPPAGPVTGPPAGAEGVGTAGTPEGGWYWPRRPMTHWPVVGSRCWKVWAFLLLGGQESDGQGRGHDQRTGLARGARSRSGRRSGGPRPPRTCRRRTSRTPIRA